ncbi:MAG: hypothetical protein AB3N24_21790 [Leisingera sp.]
MLVLVSFLAAPGETALAQGSQIIEGSGNTMIGSGNEFVNTGDIRIILESEAALADSRDQKEILRGLSEVLSQLAADGEIAVTETAVRKLARGTLGSLATQPLTRDVIAQRQFAIPHNQSHSIAGTRNWITFTHQHCGGNYGVGFTFNRDVTCVRTGGTYTFNHEGQTYDLVFDGYTENGEAKFTIYPAD